MYMFTGCIFFVATVMAATFRPSIPLKVLLGEGVSVWVDGEGWGKDMRVFLGLLAGE